MKVQMIEAVKAYGFSVRTTNTNEMDPATAKIANGRGSNTDIGYYCDTIGGSSGSPVVAASSNRVIALHHLGGCYNKGAKISKIWPQVATYFNNTVAVGDNAGTTPLPPTARFEYSCEQLQCNFDATSSINLFCPTQH